MKGGIPDGSELGGCAHVGVGENVGAPVVWTIMGLRVAELGDIGIVAAVDVPNCPQEARSRVSKRNGIGLFITHLLLGITATPLA